MKIQDLFESGNPNNPYVATQITEAIRGLL